RPVSRQAAVAREQRIDAAIAASDGDILHAVLLPGNRLTFNSGAGLELPQLLPAIRVEGFELTGQLPGKHQAAGSRQDPREARNIARTFPLGCAGQRIDSFEITAWAIGPSPAEAQVNAPVKFTGFVL